MLCLSSPFHILWYSIISDTFEYGQKHLRVSPSRMSKHLVHVAVLFFNWTHLGSRQYFEQRNRKLGVTNGQRAALSKSAAISYIAYSISIFPRLPRPRGQRLKRWKIPNWLPRTPGCPWPSRPLKAFAVGLLVSGRTFIEHFYLRSRRNGIWLKSGKSGWPEGWGFLY